MELTFPLKSATLCGFCDASAKAYTAVVYIVLKTETEYVSRFVAAKTRVAPLQGQTVPQLQLLSAFLFSNPISSVHLSLQNQFLHLDVCCYTDSQIALYWIRRKDKEWKPFVQNCVREIHSKVPPECWHHCPGCTNPADIPSSRLTMAELSVSWFWRGGPEWLGLGTPLNPESEASSMPEFCSQELRSTSKTSHNLMAIGKKDTI